MTRQTYGRPHSIDQYLVKLAKCMTCDALLELYRQEMAREGYLEARYVKICGTVAPPAGPFGHVLYDRTDAASDEKAFDRLQNFQASGMRLLDPVTRERHCQVSGSKPRTATRALVCNQISMPFLRPDGELDVFSLCIAKDAANAAKRFPAVNLKTYATLQRYRVLECLDCGPLHGDEPLQPDCCKTAASRSNRREAPLVGTRERAKSQLKDCCGVETDCRCRAIALADIAWRRYYAGLIELNERIEAILGRHVLHELIARGLVEEEADDRRFRYVYRPSQNGMKQLRSCPNASSIGSEMRGLHVAASERPVD